MAGTLTFTVKVGTSVPMGFGASGALDMPIVAGFSRTVAFAGDGVLALSAAPGYSLGNMPFAAAGTLAVQPVQKYTVAASFSSAGTLAINTYPSGNVVMSLGSTGQLTMTVTGQVTFTPFSEENTARTAQPTPVGCAGAFVSLLGAGAGGGQGAAGASLAAHAGGGGGGGAGRVLRTFIPAASLGPTYSVARPLGAAQRTNGGAATFSSGSVSLSTGTAGAGGDASVNVAGAGGPGGVPSASGVTATLCNGTAGADGGTSGVGAVDAPDNMAGGAPGGGGGGGHNAAGSNFKGGAGGNSPTAAGGTAGAAGDNPGSPGGNAAPGLPGGGGGGGGGSNNATTNGGLGADGGEYGAGGGGSGTGRVQANAGGGGDGHTLVEFVATAPVASPISVIGTPTSTSSGSFALPAHAIGDLILVAVGGPAGTTPSKPAASGTVPAWNTIDTAPSGQGLHVAYFVATANNHTSGAWSSGICGAATVLRGQNASPIGAHALGAAVVVIGSSTAPAVTLVKADGSSFLWHIHYHTGATSWSAAPAGYTRLASNNAGSSTSPAMCQNYKNDTTSDGAVTQADGGSSSQSYRCATVEILAP